MITVITDHPVAGGTPDHQHPQGTAYDNSVNAGFNQRLLALLPGASVLDLGCAGGGLVGSLIRGGTVAVGIEGSDYSQQRGRAEWAEHGGYGGNLHTADITEPFMVLQDHNRMLFDVVTAWEFLEHIPEGRLPGVFANIRGHLRPGGLLIGSVSTITATGPGQPVEYHATIRPRDWWLDVIAEEGFTVRDDLYAHFDPCWVREPDSYTHSFCVVAELTA